MRQRVALARERQLARQGCINSRLPGRELSSYCRLRTGDEAMLLAAIDKLRLSARSYHKLLRLARTIADLGGSPQIIDTHLAEALSYRKLERLPS